MTNQDRANRAHRALFQAQYINGSADTIEDAICDLLADLHHLAPDYAIDLSELFDRAQGHAKAEIEGLNK